MSWAGIDVEASDNDSCRSPDDRSLRWNDCGEHAATSQADGSVLETHLLVTWYGNPDSPSMGVLGRHSGTERADGLHQQAMAYQELTAKQVVAGYELVAVVAQDVPGPDGMWRRREPSDVIDTLLRKRPAFSMTPPLPIFAQRFVHARWLATHT